MANSSEQSPAPSSESFSFYLLKGQALTYPEGARTPLRNPYLVDVRTVALTTEVLELWFIQSIVPLVGDAAAAALKTLMETQRGFRDEFLKMALDYRNGLK